MIKEKRKMNENEQNGVYIKNKDARGKQLTHIDQNEQELLKTKN